MHELSIVMSIVDIAEEQVKKNYAQTVDNIELEIGTMAGVEFDALEFVWDAGVRQTVLERAERKITKVQAEARCMNCGLEFEVLERFQPCPLCNDYMTEFLHGKELRVKRMTLS